MKNIPIDEIIDKSWKLHNAANESRQAYDDASAGVDHDKLHNALARLDAADTLSEDTYELVHWLEYLLHYLADRTMVLSERDIQAGAHALEKAFPTLGEDFTPEWFEKVATIVLGVAEL